jgi:hypothetical protein
LHRLNILEISISQARQIEANLFLERTMIRQASQWPHNKSIAIAPRKKAEQWPNFKKHSH